jgi:predicted nucleotidyltransferase
MNAINLQLEMLTKVAQALGRELLEKVVFVGGCTTGLLVTDEFTKEQIRYTDDVDLIVHVMGYPGWVALQEQLRQHGFMEKIDEDEDAICSMFLGDLRVDFMPDSPTLLGFSNIWYPQGMQTAQDYQLNKDVIIKLIQPEYFVATKIEAYKGRGNNDPLGSRDIEDLLNVFDGRASLVSEINASNADLRAYISMELDALLDTEYFDYAVQSMTHNDAAREALIFERIEACISNGQ